MKEKLNSEAGSGSAGSTCSQCLSDADWWGDRKETFEDRPRGWVIEYEDGADGCLPAGWYAEGIDAKGRKITAPFYHEYGPFDTKEEAEEHARQVDASYFANTEGGEVGPLTHDKPAEQSRRSLR